MSLGLFGSGASIPIAQVGTTGLLVPKDDPDHYYLKAGLRERWTPLGHTVLYGEYAKRNDMISPGAIIGTAAGQLHYQR